MSTAYSLRYVSCRTRCFAAVQHVLATCEVTLVVMNRVKGKQESTLSRQLSSGIFRYFRVP